jgi:fibronectin-binding autotransporter adhesin
MAGALTIGGAALSHAQTAAVSSGNWSDPLTWSAGEPTAAATATINGGFTVAVDQAGEAAGILDLGTVAAQTGNLTVAAPGDLTVSTTMRIGQVAGSTGDITMTGGTATVNGAVGSGFGDGDLIVGDVGNGTHTQSGGDVNVADEIIIGLADVSTGVVSVSGGNFRTNGRSILVGFDGNGTLNVSGTGNVRANHDMFVGFVEGSTGNLTQSGGTIEAGFMFSNFLSGGAGSTANINMTGGAYNVRLAFVLGQGVGTTTMNHSGGAINAPTNNGDMVVSDGGGNTSVYNISGTATVTLLHNFLVGVFNGSNGTVNQSGGTITAGDNLVIGRDGVGVWNLSGGTASATNVFLGDFDDSSGTMKISGGALNLSGNLSVGGALASNAAAFPPGHALDANGTLIVSGTGGTIDVGGDLLANPHDNPRIGGGGERNDATLVFEALGGGVSTIDVTGIADLTGAVIDVDLFSSFAAGTTFDLITATSISTDYLQASEDVGSISLTILAGRNGEILRATVIPEPAAMAIAAIGLVAVGVQQRKDY